MTPYVQDSDFTLYVGDALEVLRELPDESVHCVVTSPPYWGLRDYGTGLWDGGDPDCDHALRTTLTADKQMASSTLAGSKDTQAHQKEGYKDKCGRCGATRVDQQLGLEATPELFVQSMVEVFREVRRVLRADGTCWVNLGDSYGTKGSDWSQWKGGQTFNDRDGLRGQSISTGLKPKDLVGIPWRVAFALQADGWYLRSDIVWAKPNPMPESVTDRPTKAHEYVFLLTKSPRYFFDQEAVREPHTTPIHLQEKRVAAAAASRTARVADGDSNALEKWTIAKPEGQRISAAGRNIRSVWEIATQPYPDAHFATFPEALPERCIKAGTSERGCCPVCGAPWEREVERSTFDQSAVTTKRQQPGALRQDGDRNLGGQQFNKFKAENPNRFVGWRRTCDHDWQLAISPCTVLDPFMGSGTTALVARRLGRRSIGIELNLSYAELCARRLQQLSLLADTHA